MVALELHPPQPGKAIAVIVGAAVAVGAAELYAELVSIEARTRHPLRRDQVRVAALDAGAITFGAGFPALFFLLAGGSRPSKGSAPAAGPADEWTEVAQRGMCVA